MTKLVSYDQIGIFSSLLWGEGGRGRNIHWPALQPASSVAPENCLKIVKLFLGGRFLSPRRGNCNHLTEHWFGCARFWITFHMAISATSAKRPIDHQLIILLECGSMRDYGMNKNSLAIDRFYFHAVAKKNSSQHLHAVDARAAGRGHAIVDFVCDALDLAAASRDLAAVALEVRQIWRQRGRCRRGGVQHQRHRHRALVPRTAEALDRLLVAAVDRRRARLLQANDVAAEAEAEVARVVARYLLRGHVQFAAVSAGARPEHGRLLFVGVLIVWVLRWRLFACGEFLSF